MLCNVMLQLCGRTKQIPKEHPPILACPPASRLDEAITNTIINTNGIAASLPCPITKQIIAALMMIRHLSNRAFGPEWCARLHASPKGTEVGSNKRPRGAPLFVAITRLNWIFHADNCFQKRGRRWVLEFCLSWKEATTSIKLMGAVLAHRKFEQDSPPTRTVAIQNRWVVHASIAAGAPKQSPETQCNAGGLQL